MTWILAGVIVALLFAVGLVAIGHGDPLAEAHPDRQDPVVVTPPGGPQRAADHSDASSSD